MNVRQTALIRVRVTPRASVSRVERWEDGFLHVRVSAPPAEGAANKAVIELVASALGAPKSHIKLKSGAASREKTLEVTGISREELEQRAARAVGPADSTN